MAGIKIKELTQATALSDEDLFIVEQEGDTKSVKGGTIRQYSGIKISPVEPTPIKDGDVWIDTTNNILKYRVSGTWITLGATYN